MTENEQKEPEVKSDIINYYSREHRLQKASPVVRGIYDKQKNGKPANSLFGHKGNIFLLISILVICFMYFLGTKITGRSDPAITLGNNRLTVAVTEEESVSLLSVKKTVPPKAYAYTGNVDLTVLPEQSGDGTRIMSHRIVFTLNQEEDFIVALPFEGNKFIVIFQTENETVTKTVEKAF